jgi:hypothetical protein
VVAAALLLTVPSACSSVSNVIADAWPRALGGLPEGVPPRPDTPPAFMPVHDLPPPRQQKPITAEERKQIESDITTNRGENTTQADELKAQAPQRLPPVH